MYSWYTETMQNNYVHMYVGGKQNKKNQINMSIHMASKEYYSYIGRLCPSM